MAGESEINTATPPAFPRKYRPQTTTFENTHEAVQGIPTYADASVYDALTAAQISGSGTAAAGSAIDLAGLLPGGLYEFRFFNNATKTTSQFPSTNVLFQVRDHGNHLESDASDPRGTRDPSPDASESDRHLVHLG